MHRHSKTDEDYQVESYFFFLDFSDEPSQVSWHSLQVAEQTEESGSAALVLLPTISHDSLAQVQPVTKSAAEEVWERARESFMSLLELRLWGAVDSVNPA